MDLALAAPSWLLALSAVAAVAFAWWSYGRSTPAVAGWRRAGLTALRGLGLALVLLLLFEPIWRSFSTLGDDATLAVLVDETQSLTLGAGPPAARVRDAVAELDGLAAVERYGFGETVRPVPSADSLRFDGPQTDIEAALGRIEADFSGRNLAGVVLVSDGRVTEGRSPLYLADRFPVPIHTAATSDSSALRDLRLARVITNRVATAGRGLPVRVGLRQAGYDGQTAQVVVSSGGRTLGRATVPLAPGGAETSVDLEVVPQGTGERRLTVSATALPGEATLRNNRESVSVRVLDGRRQVLVLAAGPSPDLAAVRTLLDADRDLDVTLRTQRGPGRFYEGSAPSSLASYDLIVLVGYPGPGADPALVTRVAQAADAGAALLFVQGSTTDLRAVQGALGDILPVEPAQIRPGTHEAGAAVTPAGRAHPVLSELEADPSRLSALPPLAASDSRWVLQPGAQTLLAQRVGGAQLAAPLLAVRQSGRIRSAAVLGAGIWRWRTLPPDLDAFSGVLPSLLAGTVRWTTAVRDRRPVRLRADRALFDSRERVTLSAEVYAESLEPVADADVALTIRGGGRTSSLAMRALGNGRYAADAGALTAGSYTAEAVATRGGVRLGSDRATFGVGEVGAEFREPGADLALLRAVAERSGGERVGLDTLAGFVAALEARGALDARPVERVTETPLLALPWLLALAVGLLTAEWVWRKRLGMV